MSEARIRASIDAYIAAWNERDAAARLRLISRGCAADLRLHTPGRRIEGHAAFDAMIAEFQGRRPGLRAVLSSAVDIQGHLFRYAGSVAGAAGPLGGDVLDTGECDDDGRIRVLLTFVGTTLPG